MTRLYFIMVGPERILLKKKRAIKARLWTRGFEEIEHFWTDNPTYCKEGLCYWKNLVKEQCMCDNQKKPKLKKCVYGLAEIRYTNIWHKSSPSQSSGITILHNHLQSPTHQQNYPQNPTQTPTRSYRYHDVLQRRSTAGKWRFRKHKKQIEKNVLYGLWT